MNENAKIGKFKTNQQSTILISNALCRVQKSSIIDREYLEQEILLQPIIKKVDRIL